MDTTSGVGVLDKAALVLTALESGPATLAGLVAGTGLARPTGPRPPPPPGASPPRVPAPPAPPPARRAGAPPPGGPRHAGTLRPRTAPRRAVRGRGRGPAARHG